VDFREDQIPGRPQENIYPAVIIVAARNERDKIRWNIEDTRGLPYPRDLLEAIVPADASDVGTD